MARKRTEWKAGMARRREVRRSMTILEQYDVPAVLNRLMVIQGMRGDMHGFLDDVMRHAEDLEPRFAAFDNLKGITREAIFEVCPEFKPFFPVGLGGTFAA